MAKVSMIVKNQKRIKLVEKLEVKRSKLKNLISKKDADLMSKLEAVMKLSKLPRNSSKTRVRNRCEITGRPRGYYRKFKVCRTVLRKMFGFGLISGMVKSSW